VQAAGPGSSGNRVWVRIEDGISKKPDGTSVGFRLRLACWNGNVEPFDPFTPEGQARTPRPAQFEDFEDLTVDENSPGYFGKRVPFIDLGQDNTILGPDSSALGILVRHAGAAANARPVDGSAALTDGADDSHAAGADDYRGIPNVSGMDMQGLAALELAPYREVAIVYAPNVSNDIAVQIIAHCERLRYRFAVVDCRQGQNDAAAMNPRTYLGGTSYAAFYYPWISVPEMGAGVPKSIPPGGHCVGLYARIDRERGVFKPPAAEALRGVLDLEFEISNETQDDLNPKGVNAIRRFPDRGIQVWGARTLSSDAEWQYVSIRRLLIFLERSITEGTQWVVFEPNDVRLWAQVTDSIQLFLLNQWRAGALMGQTAKDAFFVRCNPTTMTQDDILNGRLICEIGIAPVRPAEFVIFRIFQQTAAAATRAC
jgi:phage tail sheath protein FI